MSVSSLTKSALLKLALVSVSAGVAVIILWKTLSLFKKKRRHRNASSYIKDKSVTIVTTTEEWESVYPTVMEDLKHRKVLGLDCEWVGKNKVALLQICTPHGLCVLVRLSKMESPFPDSLISLLADRSILKTGVAITNDGRKLQLDYGFEVSGCVDLRHMLDRVRDVFDCDSKGLKGLSSGILSVELSKDHHIRCGDWEADHYSQAQIDYAATDAAVAVDIFSELVLAKMASVHETRNKLSTLSDDEAVDAKGGGSASKMYDDGVWSEARTEEFWKMAGAMCQGVVDVAYASFSHNGHLTNTSTSSSKRKPREEKAEIYSTRKRPLWDNCRLQAPDGTTLCTCDRRKVQWYLDKELADKVCDDPITIRLKFEPSRRPENERNYYLQDKENQCVVCGADENYVRKFIVPFEYKKFFPSSLKDHSSHDVLLLCTACHRKSCDYDSVLRQQLGMECDAPVESGSHTKTVIDHDLHKVRSAGRALKLNRGSIPAERVVELEKKLCNFFGVDSLTDELLEKAANIDARLTADNYIPHGKRVVQHMVRNGGLLAFQARWRQHFLNAMKPRFLPAYWSVDYVPEGWTSASH